MTSEDDRTIVERVLAGDKTAFGELTTRYHGRALAFARRLLGSTYAEDAVQEAFLAAFLKLENLRDHDRFSAWVLGILANVCRSRLRLLREGYFHDVLGGEAIVGFRLEDFEPSAESVSKAESCIASFLTRLKHCLKNSEKRYGCTTFRD